ncbi:MAG: conjugal transfer protein TraH [Alphaproteobacteria bacterium]|nr:conjugal transfer protein TraH [Alphaproteobacteria bacterium]
MILRIIALCLITTTAHADVSKDLTKFFNKLGGASNISKPGAYEDQRAGFYTGGNIFARNQVHNSQLATIQLPSYRAGCGGVDMFMGAFSHISSEKLVESLKAIGSNAGSFAMMIALEEMSPIVKNTMTELNDWAQKINSANINSCEIAATALGSVWPRSDIAKGHMCKMIGTEGKYGGFSDYAAARQGCGAGGERSKVMSAAENDPRFKTMLGTEFNLAWKAIQENHFLNQDLKLAEFFMSVSGTIISNKESNDDFRLHSHASLANNNQLLGALLHGGKVEIYKCTDNSGNANKCLKLVKSAITIDSDKSLIGQVRKVLESIQNKIYADEALSPSEIAFLNSTRLPFYKIINVSTAFRRGQSPVDILDYAELGAVDILFQYLTEILDVINESADHIRSAQIDDTQINAFLKSLGEVRKRIMDRRMGSFKEIEQVINMVKKTELLEKTILNKAGSLSEGGL